MLEAAGGNVGMDLEAAAKPKGKGGGRKTAHAKAKAKSVSKGNSPKATGTPATTAGHVAA